MTVVIVGSIFLVTLGAFFVSLSNRDRGVLFSREKTFRHDNLDRKYIISEPKNVTNKTSIIVGLHGFGDFSRRFAYYSALHNVVNEHDIVIYPQASEPTSALQRRGWNAGFCCGSGWLNKVDDVGFVTALVDHVREEFDVSSAQVFVSGFSNGAFMSQRLAAERPESFKAFASVAGTIGTTKTRLEPNNPVPILLMHGKQDRIVPFEGGAGGSDPDFIWLSHVDTFDAWQDVNGEAVDTKQIIYENDGHKWHDWRILNFWHKKPKASIEIVNFFNEVE